jgi:hypothetical protein
VAEVAYQHGIATQPRPPDLPEHIRSQMFSTEYPNYAPSSE